MIKQILPEMSKKRQKSAKRFVVSDPPPGCHVKIKIVSENAFFALELCDIFHELLSYIHLLLLLF